MSSPSTGSGQGVVSAANAEEHRDNDVEPFNSLLYDSSEHEASHLVHIYMKMLHVIKEISLMLLFFAVYAALSHDPPKVSRGPPAFPFFPENSYVKDWYRGEVSDAVQSATDADIGIIMFYAPWDADCQELRSEFELAARHMHRHVAFSAVNCWQPGTECRRKYKKVYRWPVILAYITNRRIVQYNGPKKAIHIMRFLNNMMHPFIRINSTQDVVPLQLHHDAVVVAKIDVQPGSWTFAAMYGAMLKFLERDPFGEVAFTILPKSRAEEPFLRLHLWNETLIFPDDVEFKVETIVNWITKHMHQVSMWVVPTGSKSQQLSMYLRIGPALILFTPQNPLADSMDYYNMLKITGMEYFNCDNNLGTRNTHLSISLLRVELWKQKELLLRQCSRLNDDTERIKIPTVTYSQSALWTNSTCKLESNKWQMTSTDECKESYFRMYMNGAMEQYGTNGQYCLPENSIHKYRTSMISDKYDSRSPHQLSRRWLENWCNINEIEENYHSSSLSTSPSADTNLTGLACMTNNSLSFLALDSLMYHQFAERFGVDVLAQKNKTALLIINDKEEVHYIFEGYVSQENLKEFIVNYTRSNLPRALHSSSINYTKAAHSGCNSNDVCIVELNSRNFIETVMDDQVVIVLYYSKQCTFCNGISYTFLTASKILSSIKNIVFARIDGDLNTLPWEFTMETYPAILFFPDKRKSESRAYPVDLPITVTNIISFILINLKSTLKLQIMWSICSQIHPDREKRSCISTLRAENLVVIEETLRAWRQAEPRMKRGILRKLQHLKSLHLKLAAEPKLTARSWHNLKRTDYEYL